MLEPFADFHKARPSCARLPGGKSRPAEQTRGSDTFTFLMKRYNRTFEELFLSVLKESPMRIRVAPVLVSTLLLTVAGVSVAQEPTSRATPAATEGVLKAADIGAKLFPDRV